MTQQNLLNMLFVGLYFYKERYGQSSYGILNTFFKDISRTFSGQFMSFSRTLTIVKKRDGAEGTIKYSCDLRAPRAPWRPGQSSGGGPGAKLPEAPTYFISKYLNIG